MTKGRSNEQEANVSRVQYNAKKTPKPWKPNKIG